MIESPYPKYKSVDIRELTVGSWVSHRHNPCVVVNTHQSGIVDVRDGARTYAVNVTYLRTQPVVAPYLETLGFMRKARLPKVDIWEMDGVRVYARPDGLGELHVGIKEYKITGMHQLQLLIHALKLKVDND